MSQMQRFVDQRVEPAGLLALALGVIGFNYLTAYRVGGYFPLALWAAGAVACAALFWLVVGKQKHRDGDTKTWFVVGSALAGTAGVVLGWALHVQLATG